MQPIRKNHELKRINNNNYDIGSYRAALPSNRYLLSYLGASMIEFQSPYRVQTLENWKNCQPDLSKMSEISDAVNKIMQNFDRYKAVEKASGVPAYVVACIHYRESSFNFKTHLANGDPLFDKITGAPVETVHVPKGLGPFKTWEDGAAGALLNEGLALNDDWDLVSVLLLLEGYNGMGYRKYHNMNTPYVWSFSNQYSKGKYGSDGHFDPELVDQQAGCAVLLMGLRSAGLDLKET